jgi:hypothetical protein
MFVNCPIVPAGTTLEGGEALTQGWNDGEAVFYPDFGPNSRAAIPIWVFVEGFNADGSPQLLEGQNNIIDAVPGDAGYSAFWQVNFVEAPDGYVPNSIRSAAGVQAAGYPVTQAPVVVNCPVTFVAAATAAPPAPATPQQPVAAPATGTGGPLGSGPQAWWLAVAVGAAALAAAGGAMVAAGRRVR